MVTTMAVSAQAQLLLDGEVVFDQVEREAPVRNLPVSELGSAGVYYTGGLAPHGLVSGLPTAEHNREFKPLIARGSRYDHGLYEQIERESPQITRSYGAIVQGLQTGDWWTEAAQFDDPKLQAIADEQAKFVDRARMSIYGGWLAHLNEASSFLMSGFSVFQEVYDPSTFAISRMAFRYPKLVSDWVLDGKGQKLVAVRFDDPGKSDYYVPAQHLMLLTYNGRGNNFEGIPLTRATVQWVRLKQLFMGLQAAAGEKWGLGLVTLQADQGVQIDATQMRAAINSLTKMQAGDQAVIELPNGVTLTLHSAAGQMPDFGEVIRYCDEQIATPWTAEGSLIVSSGTHALADVKDRQQVASMAYFAGLIAEVWNGHNNTAHTGPIKKMVDARWGGAPDGLYPTLKYAVERDSQDPEWLDKVMLAKEKGALTWDAEDELMLRERLDWRIPTADDQAVNVIEVVA